MRTRWSGPAVLLMLFGALLVAEAAEAQDELFVANQGNNTITVYRRAGAGDVPPLRTLGGLATGLNFPTDIALDLTNNELIVANYFGNSIRVYSRAASGDTAPLRVLTGAATG